jgi:transcriptional regulator with XRE-family HTH domain
MQKQTVAETVAGNIRAYRQLRGLDQATLARHMRQLGFAWRQVTVSEAERNERSVTIAEMLGLAAALATTVEQLVDTRGPEGRRGPQLVLTNQLQQRHGIIRIREETGEDAYSLILPPDDVTALVCPHKKYLEIDWGENVYKFVIHPEEEPTA